MTNLEKYQNAFVEGLELPCESVESATMDTVERWDSIGQMSLMAIIEDEFQIEFEPDEIIAFTSYQAGLELPCESVESATMDTVERWDSIGQMSLMAIIEDEFQIEFEPDEIIAFTSYQAGLDILRKRNIEF